MPGPGAVPDSGASSAASSTVEAAESAVSAWIGASTLARSAEPPVSASSAAWAAVTRPAGVVALGLELWAIALVVPTLATRAGLIAPLLVPAPVLLAFGVLRRSEAALLLGVPVAAIAPLLLPELETARQGRGAAALLLAALVAYLIVALGWMERTREGASAGVRRPLVPAPDPASARARRRWARRARVYRGLVAAAVGLPLALLYVADFHPATVAAVASASPHPEAAHAALTALVALVAALAYRACLLAPLEDHLDQDRRSRDALRRLARRPGRRRLALLVAAAAGLVAALAVRSRA